MASEAKQLLYFSTIRLDVNGWTKYFEEKGMAV